MRLLILTVVLLGVTSCKKDKTPSEGSCEPVILANHSYDSIYPSEYLMTYPGSWWEYDDGNTDSCVAWVNYPIQSTYNSNGCLIVEQDMWILPQLNDMFGIHHIANDDRVFTQGDSSATIFAQLLDTVVGIFYQDTTHGGSGNASYATYHTKEVLQISDSMLINGQYYYDVIEVRHLSDQYYPFMGTTNTTTNLHYYSKDVGRIKSTFLYEGQLQYERSLVNHYIAPH